MIDRLTAADERRVLRGIEKAIALTRGGVSPDDAFVKVARELDLTPELTKRACEAFNKSKSVYVLTTRTAANRAEPFDCADPDKVVGSVFRQASKEASMQFPRKDWSGLGLESPAPAPAMTKAAAESAPVANEISDRTALHRRMGALDRFDRQRSLVGQLRLEAEESLAKAAEAMRHMPAHELKKVAHVVVNRFDEHGVNMLKVIAAKIGREMPMTKTANWAVLPLDPPYPHIDRALTKARELVAAKAQLTLLAKEASSHFFFLSKPIPRESLETSSAAR